MKEANIGLVVIPYYNPNQIDKFALNSNKAKPIVQENKHQNSKSPNKMFAKHVIILFYLILD